MPSPMRTKTSKNRLESWRWALVFLCLLLPCFCFVFLWIAFNSGESSLIFVIERLSQLAFFRPASRLRWWDPTSRLRPRGRRWGAACTPGEWWRWRTQSTTTSSSCGSCWCEWQRGSHSPQLSTSSKAWLSCGAGAEPGCVAVKVNSLVYARLHKLTCPSRSALDPSEPTCKTYRKWPRTSTTRTSAQTAWSGVAGCPPTVTFCLCLLRTYLSVSLLLCTSPTSDSKPWPQCHCRPLQTTAGIQ